MILHSTHVYAMGDHPRSTYNPVRVLVVKNARSIELRIKGSYKKVDFNTGTLLEEGKALQKTAIHAQDISFNGIKILPEERTRLYVNNRQFRGIIDILKDEEGKVFVVNHIDIEEYLYGVLYHEVSHLWPIEVLKAQAIAARTYAMYQKLVTKNKFFDLTSDVYSQMYGGRTSETRSTRKAVNSTQGIVLMYDGKVFPSYYHATCGGRTSDVTTLWNINLPALKARRCDYCKMSPHYSWKKEFSFDQIKDKLKASGYDMDIVSIKVMERDNSGRVLDVLLEGKDSDMHLSGNKFRLAIGPNELRSTNFEVRHRDRYITFIGKGWGHGIGMCQWGAFGMAREGFKAHQILEYYYPGADLVRVE
ncbi:MAG: SpoIID/LytB domain-containing protein [Candidatus Omnitrophica bacterium]|nr:SpoIID/LytB domain-containing protein [Candidatus Omnitrophota bacterium]